MSSKHRWDEPANDGQVDYRKIMDRFSALIMLLMFFAMVKIAIANHWLEQFYTLMQLMGF